MSKINYAGSVPLSTVDWPGKAATVIFLNGCPLRCPYCQNHEHLENINYVDLSFVQAQIQTALPFVSAVVFSGGEPLMQSGIVSLARFAKQHGLQVGIETNGCYPERVAELLRENLVDHFFVDVKAPLTDQEHYRKVVGLNKSKSNSIEHTASAVIKSIECISHHGVKLEIRTTVFSGLIGSEDEVQSISSWISVHAPCSSYVLQQGLTDRAPYPEIQKLKPMPREELLSLGYVAKCFLPDVRIRTTEKGEEKI